MPQYQCWIVGSRPSVRTVTARSSTQAVQQAMYLPDHGYTYPLFAVARTSRSYALVEMFSEDQATCLYSLEDFSDWEIEDVATRFEGECRCADQHVEDPTAEIHPILENLEALLAAHTSFTFLPHPGGCLTVRLYEEELRIQLNCEALFLIALDRPILDHVQYQTLDSVIHNMVRLVYRKLIKDYPDDKDTMLYKYGVPYPIREFHIPKWSRTLRPDRRVMDESGELIRYLRALPLRLQMAYPQRGRLASQVLPSSVRESLESAVHTSLTHFRDPTDSPPLKNGSGCRPLDSQGNRDRSLTAEDFSW